MPSPFYRLQTGRLFYEIQKFIPRKWRQSIKQPLDVPKKSDSQSLYACKNIINFQAIPDESMVDCLLITLKDFASQECFGVYVWEVRGSGHSPKYL